MVNVEIQRMTNRFLLAAAAWGERQRLARIANAAVFELMEPALIDAGIDPRDEICIRRVDALVRLRLDRTDRSAARAWSAALARAISDATRSRNPHVVIYRSRAQALGDLVRSVLRQDWSRVWAWKELGLWTCGERPSRGEAARETIRTLTRNPRLAMAVLGSAGREEPLEALYAETPATLWIDLAAAVLAEFGAAGLLLRLDEPGGGFSADVRTAQRAGHIARRSRLAADFRHCPATDRRSIAHSIAVLAIAEAEPWHLQDLAFARQLVTAVAGGLATKPGISAGHSASDAPTAGEAGDSMTAATGPADEPHDEDARRAATTEYGGLLFLLHIVADCDLHRSIVAADLFTERSLRWVFHQIAIALVGCDAADPAALAFAGLPPSAEPPDVGASPVTEREAAAISQYAQHLVDRLAEVCADDDGRDPLALTAWICERRAEVVGEPGWIEARFGHETVDTAIRRRGLDIDPDFVPWLGVVVRFAYV